MELFVILGVVFFLFVAFSGQDAKQIFLVGSWGLILIVGAGSVLVAMLTH